MIVISLLTIFDVPSFIVSLNVPHETDSYVNFCMAAMLFSVVESIIFRKAAFSTVQKLKALDLVSVEADTRRPVIDCLTYCTNVAKDAS
jgi:hypothetical protein